MLPDAEVLQVINSILAELELGIPFLIKVNHRKILDAMIQLSGASSKKFKAICSTIDKLDKVNKK
jgi:histidyl-tRNA synthetase